MKIFLTTAGITMLWTSCKKIDGPVTPNVDPVVINLSLSVSSPEVKAPVAVRYCFKNFEIGNLKNQGGLPLIPFRTDNWE